MRSEITVKKHTTQLLSGINFPFIFSSIFPFCLSYFLYYSFIRSGLIISYCDRNAAHKTKSRKYVTRKKLYEQKTNIQADYFQLHIYYPFRFGTKQFTFTKTHFALVYTA
jgi:hypothetical protein